MVVVVVKVINNSKNFSTAFSFIKSLFVKVFYTLDSISIFGDFSILDFNIALLLLGAILPVVIVTVRNWSSRQHYENVKSSRSNSSDR